MESIEFDKQIYKLDAIKKAITEFEKLANFSIIDSNEIIKVKINKIDPEVKDILKDEFANYVLGMQS